MAVDNKPTQFALFWYLPMHPQISIDPYAHGQGQSSNYNLDFQEISQRYAKPQLSQVNT